MTKAALLASVFTVSFGSAIRAADLILSPGLIADEDVALVAPAVSGPNGKIELALGGITDPDSAIFRAGGSVSVPVGESFGIQGDLGFQSVDGEWAAGGALHFFTRDPSSYLLGVTAGVVLADGATLAAVGPEAELYLDRISLEGWLGWASIDYDDALLTDDDGFFAMGDLAFYPTDDWRISIGAATILGSESLKLATEYQFAGLGFPLSGTGEVRGYDTGSWSAKIGIKGYFGEPDKSLIDRHRQDDPPNRVLDLFGAAGNLMADTTVEPGDFDNETACREAGFYWNGPTETEGACEATVP